MFEKIEDSEFLFNYLNNHFNNKVQFINEEYFIIRESSIYLIIYYFQGKSKNLVGFKINLDTQIHSSCLQLLTFLEDQDTHEIPFFLKVADGWHQFLLNLKSDEQFFDAH